MLIVEDLENTRNKNIKIEVAYTLIIQTFPLSILEHMPFIFTYVYFNVIGIILYKLLPSPSSSRLLMVAMDYHRGYPEGTRE